MRKWLWGLSAILVACQPSRTSESAAPSPIMVNESGAGSGHAGNTGSGGSPSPASDAGNAAMGEVAADAIVGFGVNGQPRNWGTNGAAVKPALDMLVGDLGANFFRIEIFKGESYWEQVNDDADPSHFEWSKYDPIFSGKDFTDLWDYIRYLNGHGVTEIELAAHGLVPDWMGGQAVSANMEDEYIETLLAVLLYARTRVAEPRPQFTMMSPWNETDIGPPEGVRMTPDQGVGLLRKLAQRMSAYPELADIGIVAPEASNERAASDWSQAMKADSIVSGRLRGIGFHRYGGYSKVADWKGTAPRWLTEFNDWNGYCYTANWGNAMALAGNLLGALQSGITAGLIWTDYDAPHIHDNDKWETFGLLGASFQGNPTLCDVFPKAPSQAQLDSLIYTPKPTYYAARHAFHFILRGARRIDASGQNLQLVAFANPDGSTAVFGENSGDSGTFSITVGGAAPPAALVPHVSTDGSFDKQSASVALAGGTGSFALPGHSIFTLVGAARK